MGAIDEHKNPQLHFLISANNSLADHTNQKRFINDPDNTNPHQNKLCVYVVGGWAVNRYDGSRKTNDIDLFADERQIDGIINELKYSGNKSDSSPDTVKGFTNKQTIQLKSGSRVSVESRSFLNDKIKFGKIVIDRDWLYLGSDIFYERTQGPLPFIRVPSNMKLIVLKFLSIIGRSDDDHHKIFHDLLDIYNLELSLKYPQRHKEEIQSLFNQIRVGPDEYEIFGKKIEKALDILKKEIKNLNRSSIIFFLAKGFHSRRFETKIDNSEQLKAINTQIQTSGLLLDPRVILHQIVTTIFQAKRNIHIFINSSVDAIFLDFIMILVAKRLQGINVEVVYFDDLKESNQPRYYTRLRFYKFLGFKIKICKPAQSDYFFTGIITDPHTRDPRLLSLRQAEISSSVEASLGESILLERSQSQLINCFFDLLKRKFFEHMEHFDSSNNLSIKTITGPDYIPFLRNVQLYNTLSKKNFAFKTYTANDLSKLLTKQRGIHRYKMIQHELVYQILKLKRNKIYAIELLNGIKHIINIPIVEVFEGNYYLIEGHTRLYRLLKKPSEKIMVLEVSGIIDEDAYSQYIYKFLDLEQDLISERKQRSRHTRDIENFTHFRYYMKTDPEGFSKTLHQFPLNIDNT